GDGPAALAELARAAEAAGFSRLWAPELYRSATVPLAIAAAATSRIELGTGVALAFTRSPFTLALEALDLDELSGGRLVLGLAAEVADGLLDHPVTTAGWLEEVVRPALREGAERAGRPAPPVAGALIVAVDDEDPEGARRAAALTVGFYATVKTYEPLFAGAGFGSRLGGIRRAFLTGDGDRLAEAVGPDMAAAFAAAGTAAEVLRRARAHAGAVDRMWLTPPHHGQDPADSDRWQAGILRTFGRAD